LLGHRFGLLVAQDLEHRRKQLLLVVANMPLEHLLQLSNLAEEHTIVLRHAVQFRQEGTRFLVIKDVPSKMYVKWGGSLWVTDLEHSPLDVVAWHGNYAPYKYDLRRYSPVGPVLYDHADPSIFTVLTSPSETPGTANIDFVIFPDRWLVAENTFRPPWYHMNVMSEFMGLVYGQYDAKTGGGFVPGGISLHNTMLPHGPDVDAFEKASNVELKPHKLEGTLAFMFETRFPQKVTAFAAVTEALQKDYGAYGHKIQKHFNPNQR
jgi:homogentisate 1,2-dioxygenase